MCGIDQNINTAINRHSDASQTEATATKVASPGKEARPGRLATAEDEDARINARALQHDRIAGRRPLLT